MSADRTMLARLTSAIRRRLPARGASSAPQHPGQVFVLGNQKAGTTAIAALLAECADESFVSDVLYTNKVRLRDLLAGRPTLAELAEKHPESFAATVVKDNDFVFLYPQLAAQFPNARFLFVVRDPRQNVRSILNRLQIPGDLEELPQEEYDRLAKKLKAWHRILTGSTFGEGGGHYIDVLADRWIRAARTYLDAPDRMRLVRYEDFDADKRGFVEQLARDLGLLVVNDVSANQDTQFQPRGDREVTPEDFFGANLERLERRCADLMPRFGYAPLTRLDG